MYEERKATRCNNWMFIIYFCLNAINLLDEKLQNPFRIIAAKKLKQLHNNKYQNATHTEDSGIS